MTPLKYLTLIIIFLNLILNFTGIIRNGISTWLSARGLEEGIADLFSILISLIILGFSYLYYKISGIEKLISRERIILASSQTIRVLPKCINIDYSLDRRPCKCTFKIKCKLNLIRKYGCPPNCEGYQEPEVKTTGEGAIGGAILGGILFGVIGAIIGAILGDKMEADMKSRTKFYKDIQNCKKRGCKIHAKIEQLS